MNSTEKEVLRHKELYYLGTPEISDQEFDKLIEALPEESPVKHFVGYNVKEGDKVKHEQPMGSLKKIKTKEELDKWIFGRSDHKIVGLPKYDGSSVSLKLIDGKLIQALTRGDGYVGIDCTPKLQQAVNKEPFLGEYTGTIRCEVVVDNKDWVIAEKTGRFTAQRNMVAGLLNRKYTPEDEVFYNFLSVKPFYSEGLDYVVDIEYTNVIDYDQLKLYKESFDSRLLTDGIVLVDTSVPTTFDKHNYPENQVAVKFDNDGIEAEVDHIDWEVSRHGKLKPVVIFKEPVDLDGAMISKATGHNMEYVSSNNIGEGSLVQIIRSGGVIPYIKDITLSTEFRIPARCPSCWSGIFISGVDLECSNPYCMGTKIKQNTYWFVTLGMEDFSESTFTQLYTEAKLKDIKHFYWNTKGQLRDKLVSLDGWQDRKIDKFLTQLTNTQNVTELQVLKALGVYGIGTEIWKSILKEYTIDKLLDDIMLSNQVKENLITIDGISMTRATLIYEFLYNNLEDIRMLLSYLIIAPRVVVEVKDTLKGLAFCITGKLENNDRKTYEDMIKSLGGKISSSKFNYLITNEDSMTNKRKKAVEIGANIITENKFIEMYLDKE